MIEQPQTNLMLKAIENPIRRKIIKRLSQEPSYPLELAKEIRKEDNIINIIN